MARLYPYGLTIVLEEKDKDDVAQDLAEGRPLVFGESSDDPIYGHINIAPDRIWEMQLGLEKYRLRCVGEEDPGDYIFEVVDKDE